MDKVVVITGDGRGIGAATAFNVCVNYRRSKGRTTQLVEDIQGMGAMAITAETWVRLLQQ